MGKFIVFEGLDGSGKTSQIEILAENLRERGEKVYVTAEPTDYETGKYLRRMLSESCEKDMYLQAALFLADRIEHITHPEHGVKKYLDNGYTVICDRYYYSSLAYQGTNKACSYEWVRNLNLNCPSLIKPDVCFFLDVDPLTCKDRIDASRENAELYEKSVEQMSNIRCGFMQVFNDLRKQSGHNIVVLDANGDMNEISKEILNYV